MHRHVAKFILCKESRLLGVQSGIMATNDESQKQRKQQHIILFYKYHPLSNDRNLTALYRDTLEQLCKSLLLKGRILVGVSESEGINGTLAGEEKNVRAFTYALLGEKKMLSDQLANGAAMDDKGLRIIKDFWRKSHDFFEKIGKPALEMKSPEDFKWSVCTGSEFLFPDLNIKLVKELIGSGGVLSSIPLEETAQGYLTPKQWHDELSKLETEDDEDTILIDCRNTKECQIGHFNRAIDPNTTTFAQFPKWVDEHRHIFTDKKVLMYCTGGIRCEKASAYMRRQVPNVKSVHHLQGGIHKYLEEVRDGISHWRGKNFVFDSRVAASAVETKLGRDGADALTTSCGENSIGKEDIVGKCNYCHAPWDRFDPHCVCTVCREPILVCEPCQAEMREFHCKQHFHLRHCYFNDLKPFIRDDLYKQLEELETILVEIAVGKRYKQKRKTLNKQCNRVRQYLSELEASSEKLTTPQSALKRCRNCDEVTCNGRCWGFYSLRRKTLLEQKKQGKEKSKENSSLSDVLSVQNRKFNKRERNRDRNIEEVQVLQLSLPPCAHRNPQTSIRIPPPCTKILKTKMKGKWKGLPVLQVMKTEFVELSKPGVLQNVLDKGLLRVNDCSVSFENAGLGLKTGDTISRITHFHEPLVQVPERISVQRIPLPSATLAEYDIPEDTGDAVLYVCNKPSSVPVHPTGPYVSNSLTMMVEAQEKLPPLSLLPCHRTDRVTSGLTICCTNATVARIVQKSMCGHMVQKLYLARVHGRFLSSTDDISSDIVAKFASDYSNLIYVDRTRSFLVDAPVETTDPANGIRSITMRGKEAKSMFRLLSYDPEWNVSVISCFPLTGRSHQLRVHLEFLGFPIVNDILYGGKALEGPNSMANDTAILSLIESTKTPEAERKGPHIPDNDVLAARSVCALCQSLVDKSTDAFDAVKDFFTPAQLLQGGHAIDLHAFWYRISILANKKEDAENDDHSQLEVMDLKVDPPVWASPSVLSAVDWLGEP